MTAIKKNVIYWGRVFEKTTGSMFLGIVLYVGLMAFIEGDWEWKRLESKMLAFCIMFVMISTFAMAFQALNVYFPLTISLGSTRKNSFLGMQLMQHVIIAQWVLLGAVGCSFFDVEIKEILSHIAVGIIGCIVVLVMLANVMCMLTVRFGKTAGVIAYIVSLVGMIAGIAFFLASGTMDSRIGLILEWFGQPVFLLLAIVMDTVVIFVYYKVILKYNY